MSRILKRYYALVVAVFLLVPVVASAQEELPAPQLLYRDDSQLILANASTGELIVLPITVSESDRFAWSPDGEYLLAQIYNSEINGFCLNLYDVHALQWQYEDPIACMVNEVVFSPDGTWVAYTFVSDKIASVWLLRMTDLSTHRVFQSEPDDDPLSALNRNSGAGVSEIEWSPTGKRLTFVDYYWGMGGTYNYYNVVNLNTRRRVGVSAPNTYYANYTPIWSPDDDWFLIILKEQYAMSGAQPWSSHKGDVYLANAETGNTYRLTYTPGVTKTDIRWTDNGSIAFTSLIEEATTLTLEQAMNVDTVPYDQIPTPKPFEDESPASVQRDGIISADDKLGAEILPEEREGLDHHINTLRIFCLSPYVKVFSVPINGSFNLIGWRPSETEQQDVCH